MPRRLDMHTKSWTVLSTAIGLWGGMTGLGVALGPVVGGAVDGISWHWIFWLNVPVGVALIPLAAAKLTESFGPRPPLDIVGLVLAGAGALALTWGLVRGNAAGWGSGEPLPPAGVRRRQRGELLHVRRAVRSPVPDGPVLPDLSGLLAAHLLTLARRRQVRLVTFDADLLALGGERDVELLTVL